MPRCACKAERRDGLYNIITIGDAVFIEDAEHEPHKGGHGIDQCAVKIKKKGFVLQLCHLLCNVFFTL